MVKTYGEAARFYLVFYGGSGSTQEGDPRGARLRRRENECRYRHAIRIHTRGRRADVQERRRRAESGRRSRQQESL